MRRKQVADRQPFEIRRSIIQGRGAFATRPIRSGERIAEYTGQRISWKEADRRYDDESMARHHTFLFAVTSRTVIDGSVGGSDARFINHSCDPNCEAVDDRGRIFIEARRNVAVGDELTYDYAYERDASTGPDDEVLYRCVCGSSNCRGTILAPVEGELPSQHHAAARHPHHGTPSSPASDVRTRDRARQGTRRGARSVKT